MMLSVLIHPYQSMYMMRSAGHVEESMMNRDMEVMSTLFLQPGIQQWWAEHRRWWHPPFTQFLDEAIARNS